MKTCKDCGLELPFAQFYKNVNVRGGYLNWCKRCNGLRYGQGRSERAKRDRLYFQAIKLERGCSDCGYRENAVALDFDHLPGVEKKYRIACMAGMRRELIDAEIEKCEVVCANCHRIRTASRLQYVGENESADTPN
ncbi:hypothetical protein EAO71_37190 [Streptomyces sp. ms191]|uniref:hypothetical protein n=1 Tax=Streptomyces sp. ms191 TaxID=1827978 RepID=UPI0011CD9EA7|nr:hypothetical protein [Streptomyces sp. ms191]TXS08238.1 hypothetical protein EAO71_37190 [Streptomyces sp. ms191]